MELDGFCAHVQLNGDLLIGSTGCDSGRDFAFSVRQCNHPLDTVVPPSTAGPQLRVGAFRPWGRSETVERLGG